MQLLYLAGSIRLQRGHRVGPETVNAVPEPATALLLGGGAMLMGVVGRRRRAVAKAPQLA